MHVDARADTPITQGALDERKAVAWLEWHYASPGDDGHPFEWKRSDWGYLDGCVVAVGYAATAIEPTEIELKGRSEL